MIKNKKKHLHQFFCNLIETVSKYWNSTNDLYNNFVYLFARIDEFSLGDNVTTKCSFDKGHLETKKESYVLGGKFKQGSKGFVSALALSIRSLEATWSYLFVCCSMPSLASSTAKEHLQLSIMTLYISLFARSSLYLHSWRKRAGW